MRFLFVDQIRSMNGNKITGSKYFKADEPLRYVHGNGTTEVAPGVISEAVGQLVSWLAISKNDFVARPVFLFADRIEIVAPVAPGSLVELEATIDSLDKEMITFSGTASVAGEVVHEVEKASGYLMPLGQLEDPHVTRSRMEMLNTSGLNLAGHGVEPYAFSRLIDGVELVRGGEEVMATKIMQADEPFYADHFPRFPVTPIVMVNEMIGQATARMFGPAAQMTLRPRAVRQIKIKNFIKPGERCEIQVKLKSRESRAGVDFVTTIAEVRKDGKRILRGLYDYELAEAGQ